MVNCSVVSGMYVVGYVMLFIGYIKLFELMLEDEGWYCVIMVNSWGEGFGVGGYVCFIE